MSGICGIFNTIGNTRICEQDLMKMSDAFAHRGPDGEGYLVDQYYGLGFRHLNINGNLNNNKPFMNEDNSVQIVCNGRIYNHNHLREKLISKGHFLNSSSDLDVLVHMYEEYGMEMLNKLNGQFAFALIDRQEHKLFLVRDHFGIAPLYYTVLEDTIYFASEIKGLIANHQIERKVDLTGMDQFFSLPHPVSPRTMFKNIFSLPPGHYLEAKEGFSEITKKSYWDIDYPLVNESLTAYDESYYVDKLEGLLLNSVELRTQADVSVGAFLSGGLDSSLITCMMKKLSSEQRKIFSIYFENKEFSEQKYQKIVADQLGYEHFEEIFKIDDIAKRLENVVYHSEAPLKESFNSATLALSKMAKKENINVILTGEGSDELFAGYPSYRFDKLRNKRKWNEEASLEEKTLREKVWGDPLFKYETDFLEMRSSKNSLFSRFLNESYDEFDFTGHDFLSTAMIKGRHPIHQRSYIDLKVRLADHLISDHSDRMLMANSVEGRFPFLDIDLVNFIRYIPVGLKLNNFDEKYIVKQVAAKYVPEPIIKREKFIFIAPGSPFLLKQDYEWIMDLLSYETIKRQGYFDPDAVEHLKKKFVSPDFHLKTSIDIDYMLMVIMFCLYLKVFGIADL
ncbi:MAG: asparagine synthase (glutamine-hydrolyzing) [Lachnospiraceae bacterium]|nr:asparagine synthase (glutamine-hydrolyzing) [Lachnospiraceae bacterium]